MELNKVSVVEEDKGSGEDRAIEQINKIIKNDGDVGELEKILENFPDLLEKELGQHRNTLLHRAALAKSKKVVKFLIDRTTSIDKKDAVGFTALHLACKKSDVELVNMLISGGSEVNLPSRSGDLPVHLAAGHSLEVVKVLVKAGADLHETGHLGYSCLHYAAENDNLECARYFIDEGVSPTSINRLTETPLHVLAAAHSPGKPLDCVKLLLESGGDINARTEWGTGPVHHAALTGSPDLFKYLLEEGCLVSRQGSISARDVYIRNDVPPSEAEDLDLDLLCKAAKSADLEKVNYIIDRMIDSRTLEYLNMEYSSDEANSMSKKMLKMGYVQRELTDQEIELCRLAENLSTSSITDSPLAYISRYAPDSLNYLLDKMLVQINPLQIQGKIFLDHLLFTNIDDVETSVYRTILGNGKERVLKHPIFQLFSKLKWQQLRSMMVMCIVWALLYYCFLIVYVLSQESHHLKGKTSEPVMHGILIFFFIGEMVDQGLGILSFLVEMFRSIRSKERSSNSDVVFMGVERVISFSAPILLGYYLFTKDLEGTRRRDIGTVLVALSTYNLFNMIAQVPKIGIQKLMMFRVFSSICAFVITFIPVFVAFAVIFHVLLPNVEVFTNMDTSIIKVCTMLMGEFDFTSNFVEAEDSTALAKFFFFASVIFMSLVMMNLVLGIAVADVSELEQVSKVKSAVLEYYILSMLEGMLLTSRKYLKLYNVIPNPSVFKYKDLTDNYVCLDLVDLEKDPNNRIYVSNMTRGVINSFECPHELLMSIIEILRSRQEHQEKAREEALEEEKKDQMFEMLERLVQKQEKLEENLTALQRTVSELNSLRGGRGSALNNL